MTWTKVTKPKNIVCDYPLRNGWAKFYTSDDDLEDVTHKQLVTNSLNKISPHTEFRISEHGNLSALVDFERFSHPLTEFTGDVIFYVEGNSYLTFIAKIKNGEVLGIFHFPQKDHFEVDLNETPDYNI
ncbi:hypothetical protein HN803_04235 [candidate division WWE3 bacterium]|jgi:hypothetical protein|nr:hypothetical protein [candidate division WWE3 bacterium]